MVKIFCPGLPDGYVPVPALAPWLARHWLAAPANNARADPIGVDAFQPGSSQSWICLIDAGDRVHRLPDDEVLGLAAAGPGTDLASLMMAATHLLVSEAVLAARRSGKIQHLMHLPLDEAGTTKLVDLVFLPLGPATRAKGSVLILASATRKQELQSAGTDDTVPQTDRAASRNAVLAKQLTASRLHLKTAVERLELSNDRLQMAFDDLQRAHTELEAYAADLRALTEELERMNHTHRQKIVELEQLTADMAGLLDSIDVGVVFVDPALRVRRCASVAARMLRLDEPGEGRPLADVAAGLHDDELVSLVRLTLENGDPFEREVACWETSRFLIRVLPHAAADGSVAGAVVTLIDVTAYREAEAGRVQSEERWRRLVDTAPDGILMHEGGVVEMANRSALRILAATSLEHLVGRKLMDLIIPEGRHAVERQLAKAAQEGIVTEPATTAVRTQDGRRVEVEITTATLSEGGRQAFQTVLRDVTERRRAEAEIKRLVHHDRLTGLSNRTLLLDRLETAMARAARDGRHGALMLLDLDQFKDVNDTLGHAAGDRLLQIVARRLRSTLRSTDTLARLGGDEFAIVQTDLSSNAGASGAATLAQKALDSIAEPISVDDHDLFVTCSMGVTLFPIDATSADQLIKNADLALYRAKAEGGQRFQFFLEQMNAEVLHKKSLEREIL
ncbi:MAG TPA: diguanylate cyclase [Geminicoccus sp.]|uniref:diguanylate cyclase domain-containing protein n=1 Tax=Geminicoccus sp. TaxID=2024832 RepID=UPI002E326BDA|nr:diguanylate cyclase [Geminicoccus sp.]HEX2529608.1 diguanylate cyclase [Geminicoccus sp.]